MHPTDRSKLCASLLLLASTSIACSSKEPPGDPMLPIGGAAAATGGIGASGMNGASGVNGMAITGGVGGEAASAATGGTGQAGAAGSMPVVDAGGMGGDSGMPPDTIVTECDGMALPARAVRSATPPAIGPAAAGLVEYWPTTAWQSMEPSMLGFDAAKLDTAVAFDTMFASTQAILVVRHGYIAAEEYFGTFSATARHESYSMAKSFSSALIGIAIEQGLLTGIDQKLCEFYPTNWDCADAMDPRSRITIEHAMNISTGLQWSEDWSTGATGPNDALSFNMLATALARPAVEEPGTRMRYSTGDPALLSGVFEGATGKSALAYGREVLFGPIGIPDVQWTTTGNRTNTYANLQATAREYAKFGYLFLNHGVWDGEQIVPADWVDLTTQGDKPCEDWYRFLWHQNPPVRLGTQDPACDALFCHPTAFADLPPDAFFAEGVNGQFIYIVPSADMVVVRLANDSAGSEHWDDYSREFLGLLLDAVL